MSKREIKYKVFDSISKVMHDWDIISGIALVQFSLDHYTLLQYTGLKDKNGKEIYEGDIIKTIDRKGVVVYVEDRAMFIFNDTNNYNEPICNFYILKIIGNIHQDPELLK